MQKYRKKFIEYYSIHYSKYEQKNKLKFMLTNVKFENFILINSKNKILRKQKRNIDLNNEAKRYFQNRCIINDKKLTFENV